MNDIRFVTVTPQNVDEKGLFCIKDKDSEGFRRKAAWFKSEFNKGIRIIIAEDSAGKQLGFIEYLPSEAAWRPVNAQNYLFIQCIMIYGKDVKNNSVGSQLIRKCEEDANACNKDGICAMSSKGTWIAGKSIFEKNGFELADKRDRFELMYKPFGGGAVRPHFIECPAAGDKYTGWHLLYTDQCPWHEKAVDAISQTAGEHGIELSVIELKTPEDARNTPSGYGTFALIKDGKLLEDHYISKTRFENIIKKHL